MSLKERVVGEVEMLNKNELQAVAEYVSFLKYRAQENLNEARLKNLYREFEREDRAMAQADIESYSGNLVCEDTI